MRNQTKESRRLKDLIRIGVFSALWVVIGFLVAFTIGFFSTNFIGSSLCPRNYRWDCLCCHVIKADNPRWYFNQFISAGYLPVYDGPLWHDVLLHCGWRCDRRNPL